MTPEQKHRALIPWLVAETVLRIPVPLQQPEGWKWCDDDAQLFALTDDGEFRFHIGLTVGRFKLRLTSARRGGASTEPGGEKVRHAVVSVRNYDGRATWETDIPGDVWDNFCAAA